MYIVLFASIKLVDRNYYIKFTLHRKMVVINKEMDAYNQSFYFTESNSGGKGAFQSFSNDTKPEVATFSNWNPFSFLYLCQISPTHPWHPTPHHFLFFPADEVPAFVWFWFQCWNTSVHCMQSPLIYKRIQHSVCKGGVFISRGLGDGVITRVRLHVWSILAFCTSINISHLDVLLMAKSYSGMLLCSYFNVFGVSILHTDIHWHIFKCRTASFIILNDLSQWKDTPFVCSIVNWNGNG